MFKKLFWDPQFRRLHAFWRLLLQTLLYGFGQFVIGLGAIGFLMVQNGISLDEAVSLLSNPAELTQMPLASTGFGISSLLATLATVWLAGRWLDRRRFRDFGFRLNANWWLDFAFGLGLGALLMTLIFITEWAAGWIEIEGTLQSGLPGASFGVAIFVPLILFFCVGIYEELWSRGYHLKNLAEGFRFWGAKRSIVVAIVLSSAVFGLLHAGNPNATAISTFNIFLAGLFLGFGYILTGELAIPIGLHMSWNFFQGNVFGFPVSGTSANQTTFIAIHQGGAPLLTGGDFGPEAGLIGIAAMLLGALLIALWVHMRHGSVSLQSALATPELRIQSPQLAQQEPSTEEL
ncbi:MAG: CPBP family intramembrane metalloprotease [Caldilineaceae bacterium]|nr:CPBP family intramembrane metalloprotease [Caldilineaceae bacterium]